MAAVVHGSGSLREPGNALRTSQPPKRPRSNSEFGRSREADRHSEAWSRQPEQQIMLLQVVKAESMRVGAGGEGAGPLWVMGE